MASREKISGRTLKVLSRDDRGDGDGEKRRRDRESKRRDEREKRRDKESDKPVQGPIVLLKRPDTKSSGSGSSSAFSGESSIQSENASGSTKVHTTSGPTLILQRSSKKEHENGDQSTTEKVKIAAPPSVTELLKAAYRFPRGQAMPLIDTKMKMCHWKSFDYDANNYTGNMDYLVVTAIGRPNVGKSSILSYLAGEDKFGPRKIFLPRNREEEMHTSIYISSDQIVFIELSSVYNQAATNELIPLVSQLGVLEVSNVTWNLRLLRWALSVSHIILVISENVVEPNVFQLMTSAEIIHTLDSALGEGAYPEPIYICNKANVEVLDNPTLADQFQEHFTSVTGRTPRIETNYYLLPHMKYDMEYYRFQRFKESILQFNRYNRAPFAQDKDGLAKLVQKNNIQDWFQNASRLWDEMNSLSYFSSYVKLLP